MPETQHYLIAAKNGDGESLDLVVEATSPAEAKAIWLGWDSVASSYDKSEGDPEPQPDTIFLIPALTGQSRALDWHEPGGMQPV